MHESCNSVKEETPKKFKESISDFLIEPLICHCLHNIVSDYRLGGFTSAIDLLVFMPVCLLAYRLKVCIL